MSDNLGVRTAANKYAAAYLTHYSQRDLTSALRLSNELIVSHASTPEAAYAYTQIRNIVDAVVSRQEKDQIAFTCRNAAADAAATTVRDAH